MPIRRLPEDGAAAGIYTLLEAIETMPPVLSRAESAFDRLADSITGALDRIGAALDTFERRSLTPPAPGIQNPGIQEAAFTSIDADLLSLGEDRLHLEDLITESMVEQLTASENIASAQEDAARRSDAAWGSLSDDIVGLSPGNSPMPHPAFSARSAALAVLAAAGFPVCSRPAARCCPAFCPVSAEEALQAAPCFRALPARSAVPG